MSRQGAFARLMAIVLVAFGVLAVAAPAGAATTSVTIHARICATDATGDLFTECHPNPAPAGQAFRLDHGASQTISKRGNVAFANVAAGSHIVALTAGDQPNEFLKLRAFCSDANTSAPAVEVRVRSTSQASFRIAVKTGQRIVCDVYWLPESGQ